ncbi:MAG TPA: L,D-transpeptidase family protein [Thermoanaerobaculia bacterium]|nr:L,D-transpeptidase family protein [Thermoanaerobaculia bacterium]
MRKLILSAAALFLLAVVLFTCGRPDDNGDDAATRPAVTQPEPAPQPPRRVSAPSVGFQRFDPAVLEHYRLDPAWRAAAERDRLARVPGGAARPGAPAPVAPTTEPPPPLTTAVPLTTSVPEDEEAGEPGMLAAQVLLGRAGFSPGVIDGRGGQNTDKALYWFQFARGLTPTGTLDDPTRRELERAGGGGAVVDVEVTAEDVAGPFTEVPEDVYEQAELECLCYASAVEAIAERYHTTPELLAELNPDADLDALAAGARLRVPNVEPLARGNQRAAGAAGQEVAQLVVSKRGFYTQALDGQGRILYHFPSTIGSKYDPSPQGQFKVTGVAFNPPFHYQPTLFHEVPDEEPEAQLPEGPNSPVGLVWIDLSKPHHGIHGTAVPETIGYTSSHGCIRLTNWDALFLARRVRPGVPVHFRE